MVETRNPFKLRWSGSRILLGIVGALLAIAIGNQFLGSSTQPDRSSSNGRSSSFDANSPGTLAYAELLRHYGYRVDHLLGPIDAANIDSQSTLFVLDAGTLPDAEANAIADYASRGGHVVVGDTNPQYLGSLHDNPPRWRSGGRSQWLAATDLYPGVNTIATADVGAWSDLGASRVIIGDGQSALLTVATVGSGTIEFLADTTPVSNALIGSADNAAFAVGLAGSHDRTILFAEGVHGYGASAGLSAIPSRWKFALVLLALAAVVFAWSRGIRFGPPEQRERLLAPPRAAYVDALAASMQRTGDADAVRARLAASATATLHRLYGKAPDGEAAHGQGDGAGASQRRVVGCDEAEWHALFGIAQAPNIDDPKMNDPKMNDPKMIAAARTFVRINRLDPSIPSTARGEKPS